MPGVSLTVPGRLPALRITLFLLAVVALPAPAATSLSSGTNVPPLHLTDAQDQLSTTQLSPQAEAKATANALYANTMLGNADIHPQATLDQLKQVAALDPQFADAQVRIASLLMQSGQSREALKQLQAAALANPKSAAIEGMLGYVQHATGNKAEALRLARDALTRDPTPAQAGSIKVLLTIADEKNELAAGVLRIQEILKAAGATAPSATWLTLARLYVETSRSAIHPPSSDTVLKTLLPIYQVAASRPPPDTETLGLLSDTLRDLGRKREALKVLQEAAALDPSNVDLIIRCADLQTAAGLKAEALHNYERAYDLEPGLAGLRETLAPLYLETNRFDDAARLACPPEAYLKLAVFHLAHKQIKEAGVILAAAVKQFPQSPLVLFYQAVQQRCSKNYTAALANLEQVKKLADGGDTRGIDLNYYLELTLNLDLAGLHERMEPALREGLTKFPNSPELLNELAYVWADAGIHLPEALEMAKRAIELDPDNGPIQDTRGWIDYQMGNPKDALPYLQRAAILTNNDPVVLQHVGDTYLKLGKRTEAISAWRRALQKDPGNGDLTKRITAAQAQANNAHHRSAPTP